MRWVCSRKKVKKNIFLLILRVLGWSKLLDLDWRSRKFPRMDSFGSNKKFVMLDRTLATPNNLLILYIKLPRS